MCFRPRPYRGPFTGRAGGDTVTIKVEFTWWKLGLPLTSFTDFVGNFRDRVKWGVWSHDRTPEMVYRLYRGSFVSFTGGKQLGFNNVSVPVVYPVPFAASVAPRGSRWDYEIWGEVTTAAAEPPCFSL